MDRTSRLQNVYSVPQRFGLSELLALTTLFAVCFGILKFYEAPVEIYLFLGVVATIVSFAQMVSRDAPRQVSIIAGALTLPFFWGLAAVVHLAAFGASKPPQWIQLVSGMLVFFAVAFIVQAVLKRKGRSVSWPVFSAFTAIGTLTFLTLGTLVAIGATDVIVASPCLAVAGGLVGYLIGTIVAGVFLVSDHIEQYFQTKLGRTTSAPVIDEVPAGIPVFGPDSCAPYLSDEAARMLESSRPMSASDETPAPKARPLGPPASIPVFNCRALVSRRRADGLVHARAAEISDLRTTGQSEREALQNLVGAFKIIVAQAMAEGRDIPLLPQPHAPADDESERFIAVHL